MRIQHLALTALLGLGLAAGCGSADQADTDVEVGAEAEPADLEPDGEEDEEQEEESDEQGTPAATDRPSPVERARKLQPLVREYANQAERRLPAPVAEAREGLYRMAAPRWSLPTSATRNNGWLGALLVISGGQLNGEVVAAELPEDWSFVNELGTCALETRPADPHSVTVIRYSNAGTLYVGSMAAAVKRWPRYVLEDPRVHYRPGERIYELRATLVENEDERRAAFRARHRLNGEEPAADVEVPDNYWIFRIEARGGGTTAPRETDRRLRMAGLKE